MYIDAVTGLLRDARQVFSPHCDARPANMNAELIVVHGISLPPDEFGGPWIEQFFCGNLSPAAHPYFATVADSRVSAHLLVRRDGTPIQFVSFNERAWHAGVSNWRGRNACNDFSIGIELEGTDERPYAPAQYITLIELVRALCTAYPTLSIDNVVGHSDIAPGRKTDPGESFEWSAFRRELAL
jgi:AmpD protein